MESVFIKEYLHKMTDAQKILLEYLENMENKCNDDFFSFFKNNNIAGNKHEFKTILHFISKISQNHNRFNNFTEKIKDVIKLLKEKILILFSNYEIFKLFKNNKKILLFLFEERIILPDYYIAWTITNGKYNDRFYPQFFYPEFKSFYNSEIFSEINYDEFIQKREKGENDQFICELIRNDSVIEFISYVNRNNIAISSSKISKSVFETNSFLIKKEPTLIEYAAFYGSIQIFRYLFQNNVKITPSIWIYSIHSNNAELIHLLEEENIWPNDIFLEECLKESIKCYHNNITNYIQDNLLRKINKDNLFDYIFHSYNYSFCSDEMIDHLFNSYLNKFDFDKISFDYCNPSDLIFLSFLFKYVDLYIIDFLEKNKKLKVNYQIDFNDRISEFYFFIIFIYLFLDDVQILYFGWNYIHFLSSNSKNIFCFI